MEQPAKSHIQNKNPLAVIEPFSIISEQLDDVKSLIGQQLCSHPHTTAIEQLMQHIQAQSGKMLRPGLVLLSGLCSGNLTDEHVTVAAVFEIIHNATLLHDDVIDEADERRGQSTVNKLWGNESAVLLGDFLLSKVFDMSAELDEDISKSIAKAASRTCQGELNQNLQKRNYSLSEKEYIDIIADKTAAIFATCCGLGNKLAGNSQADVDIFEKFGVNLGIAFQIADDLTDITGDQAKAGKTLGTDLAKIKPTLPLIYSISNPGQREKIINLLNTSDTESFVKVRTLLIENGSIEYTKKKMLDYIGRAVSSLEHIDDSPAKTALIKLTEFITSKAN